VDGACGGEDLISAKDTQCSGKIHFLESTSVLMKEKILLSNLLKKITSYPPPAP
jgi:hypothetical protein